MEAITSLKRPSDDIDPEKCLICQSDKGEKLRNGTPQGIKAVKEAAQERLKRNDTKNRDSVDRVLNCLDTDLSWHKGCYSWFTSKTIIGRLNVVKGISSTAERTQDQRRLRSKTKTIDWGKCLFCQEFLEDSLHSVMSFNTSNAIIERVKFDHKLSVVLAGVSDLIAAEAKYHLKCYSKFKRDTSEVQNTVKSDGLAMGWLCTQLRESAEKGHILHLNEVLNYYCELCKETEEIVPSSFATRKATFKQKLQKLINTYDFHVLGNDVEEKGTVLVPKKFAHIPISKLLTNVQEQNYVIPVYNVGDDIFLSLVHVALKLRSDILVHAQYKGFKVSKAGARSCIPDSVYMFLKVLFGGENVVGDNENGGSDDDDKTDIYEDRILSVGQDLVYNASRGKMWTPKHVGLASTLHQATRSKSLIEMFHKAGHTVSYKNVLQIDTALAESTMKSVDLDTGALIPDNLVADRFVHFSTDNIDILDASLDGKNTFHATQLAAWQRGPPSGTETLVNLKPSTQKLAVPDVINSVFPPEKPVKSPEPKFEKCVELDWFASDGPPVQPEIHARSKDMAFLLKRQAEDPKSSWSTYNQITSESNDRVTTVGYMPIILSPAHEYQTMNTVVRKCKYISEKLGQKYVVITVDEQLYSRLMELKWSQDYEFLIPRLGGLHMAMNFMKAIGQQFQSSGLLQLWTQSDLLGEKTAEKVLAGKDYEKGMRAHKITFQAMWEILMPHFLHFLREHNHELNEKIEDADNNESCDSLVSLLTTEPFQNAMKNFEQSMSQNPNHALWFTYLHMVSILLQFTRADRDGIWDLHLSSVKLMLPYFHRFGHTNYAKYGPIYYAQMLMLPPEVEQEFRSGNFVVKIGENKFNQVPPDQSLEWLNGIGKRGGGIVGITRNLTALSRWALSFNHRSQIAKDTKEMYSLDLSQNMSHKESGIARRHQDTEAESKVVQKLQAFGVFSKGITDELVNIATKDQATEEIAESLLNVRILAQEQLLLFIKERLVSPDDVSQCKKFHNPMKRTTPPTFSKLYEVKKLDSQKEVLKVDRSVLQRLLICYASGRTVNIDEILRHELLPVPLSLAETSGDLRGGQKHLLMDELLKGVDCPDQLDVTDDATLVIDGQALVRSLDKPHKFMVGTFRDFSKFFNARIFQQGQLFSRIDVVFDRYDQMSTKQSTRNKRQKSKPIRRVIEHADVPLPNDWNSFLSDPRNKADLAKFLSQELINYAPENKCVVTSGGLLKADEVLCNRAGLNLTYLESTHEEADTRMILHCVHTQSPTVVVWSRDTDVMLLLMAHSSMIKKDIIMKAGTKNAPKYVPIKEVMSKWKLTDDLAKGLLPFHAVTGSDTTSFFYGHTKRTSLFVYLDHPSLLSGLGKDPITKESLDEVEKFVCLVYNVPEAMTTDKARAILFKKGVSQERLPPTSDALSHHNMRAHFQALIWLKATEPRPALPDPSKCGWQLVNDQLKPVLMTSEPVPESCINLISCGCAEKCVTRRCGCRRAEMPCTGLCKCSGQCFNGKNNT